MAIPPHLTEIYDQGVTFKLGTKKNSNKAKSGEFGGWTRMGVCTTRCIVMVE